MQELTSVLFIAMCKHIAFNNTNVYRTKISDIEFTLGFNHNGVVALTLPLSFWDNCSFATISELGRYPDIDAVINNIKNLFQLN